MDDKRTTDWRALSAYLANAAHRLELTVVNMASDPNLPDVVRRSPAFLASVRNAELVDVFLERWREAERQAGVELVANAVVDVLVDMSRQPKHQASAELVFRVGAGDAEVVFRSEHAKAWLFANLPAGWTLVPNDNLVTVDAAEVDDLVRRAKADNLAVDVVEA
jgi:hypothetical protein